MCIFINTVWSEYLCVYLSLWLAVPTHSECCRASPCSGCQARGREGGEGEEKQIERQMEGEKGCNSVPTYFFPVICSFRSLHSLILSSKGNNHMRHDASTWLETHVDKCKKAIVLFSHTISSATGSHALPLQSHSQSKLPCLCCYSLPSNTLLLFHTASHRNAVNGFRL